MVVEELGPAIQKLRSVCKRFLVGLVGGFNSFEKYARQIGSFHQGSG